MEAYGPGPPERPPAFSRDHSAWLLMQINATGRQWAAGCWRSVPQAHSRVHV